MLRRDMKHMKLHFKTYVCPNCGATKTLYKHFQQTVEQFNKDCPKRIICGVGTCYDYALPKE